MLTHPWRYIQGGLLVVLTACAASADADRAPERTAYRGATLALETPSTSNSTTETPRTPGSAPLLVVRPEPAAMGRPASTGADGSTSGSGPTGSPTSRSSFAPRTPVGRTVATPLPPTTVAPAIVATTTTTRPTTTTAPAPTSTVVTIAAIAATTTTTPAATTTTTTAATTTTTTTTAAPPPPPKPGPSVEHSAPVGIRFGESGERVLALQRSLVAAGFDPGTPDGRYGTGTRTAVWAAQKLLGAPIDHAVDDAFLAALESAPAVDPAAVGSEPDRVEVDLSRQLLNVYRGGERVLTSHISTGTEIAFCENGFCGDAVTPTGRYAFDWRVTGWRTSVLGELFNPVYFVNGIAVHGSESVPLRPASHGCVRIPMHIAEYFQDLAPRGSPIYVT